MIDINTSELFFTLLNLALLVAIIIAIVVLIRKFTKKSTTTTNDQLETAILLLQKQAKEQEIASREEIRLMGNDIATRLGEQMNNLNSQVNQMSQSNEERFERLRQGINQEMLTMRQENEKSVSQIRQTNETSLEQVRVTVSEKLEGTLENKLGSSFKQVSDRLEQVYIGLGAMQTLAGDVGDLQKLLKNVKTRGIWGEVQLGNILEQMLTREQYAENVAVVPNSNDRVEFAIALPGATEGTVWLPIDAKFPIEDYQRLVNAQNAGDVEQIKLSSKALEVAIRKSAMDISQKYIAPPATTDFAIMFLPIEGLYAEVLNREGLVERLQRDYRISIAGPTTLAALINSLQLGFKTLAIEQKASEVWQILSTVKTEFTKFDDTLTRVDKKLTETTNIMEEIHTRSRVMQRKLKDVEEV